MRLAARRWLALLLGGATFLAPAPLRAQTESGKVSGAVRDPQGGALPGCALTLVSVDRATVRTTVSDSEGQYAFAALVPGSYELTAELSGFATRKLRATVSVGATVQANLTLAPATQREEITVVGEAVAAVNTSSQDIAATVTESQIKELPLITRNPYDLVGLAGNVPHDNASGRGTGFAINGQRSASPNVLLDGGDNNGPAAGPGTSAICVDVRQDAEQSPAVLGVRR
jgi:hypothetical protein